MALPDAAPSRCRTRNSKPFQIITCFTAAKKQSHLLNGQSRATAPVHNFDKLLRYVDPSDSQTVNSG